MSNIFDIISKFINVNNTLTFGDLLNENKNEVKNNLIKRLCNSNEYTQYNELYVSDIKRLNNSELNDNYLIGSQKFGNDINIPGIGTVKQIC